MASWWNTPDIESAKAKAIAGGGQGVFSLDDLTAMGSPGRKAKPTDSVIGGGGQSKIDPALNLPAGYYRIPGVDGAEYYDPHSGQVSQAFADWANAPGGIKRHDLTGMPLALMDQRDSGEVSRDSAAQIPGQVKNLNDIFALGKGPDGTYQDAQDRVLGTGKYQQFLLDKNGKQMRVQDVAGTPYIDPATAPYIDRTKSSGGAFDRLSKLTGKTPEAMDALLGVGGAKKTTGAYADYWTNMRDSLASNFETNTLGAKGLQEQRAARGLDINTGTSEAERKRIFDTVSRISDPAQRAAYLKYQDPGNLTEGLRAERYDLRAGERDQIAGYEKEHPTVEYNATGKYGQPAGAQLKITSGSAVFSDTATGRENFVGSVPKAVELVKPRVTSLDRAAAATQGAAIGFISAALGNFGGVATAISMAATAASGAGFGPNVKNISTGNLRGLQQWDVRDPHMMNMREFGTALATAAMIGGASPGASYGAKQSLLKYGMGEGSKFGVGFMGRMGAKAFVGGAFMASRQPRGGAPT